MRSTKKYWLFLVLGIVVAAFFVGWWMATPGPIPNYEKSVQQFYKKHKTGKKGPEFTKAEQQIMADVAHQLKQRMPSPGLKVGTKAPDFTLTNAFDKPVSLYDALKKGPVVLVFYRGAWCPFCNLQLRALHKSLPHFKKYGANLITVTPQKPDKSLAQVKKDGYPFEILSDLDSKVMKAYKLYYRLPRKLVRLYKMKGLDLETFNGKGRNVLPAPGTFVIDQNGIIVAMEADTDYKKRMEPVDIVKALKKIKRPG